MKDGVSIEIAHGSPNDEAFKLKVKSLGLKGYSIVAVTPGVGGAVDVWLQKPVKTV